MIVDEAFENFPVFMQRKIADLDHENDVRQNIAVEFDRFFFEICEAFGDSVISDLRIVENDRAARVQSVEAKAKIAESGFVGMFAVDKTKLDFFLDRGGRNFARVAVERRDLVHFFGRDRAQLFEHPRRRIVLIFVIDAARVGLHFRAFVERKNAGAALVEQMRLNAAAEV